MRLSKVEYAPRAASTPILNFFLGKNKPARRDCIMERLVVPVEKQNLTQLRINFSAIETAAKGR